MDYNADSKSYANFIETFLAYQRLFEYSGSIQDILNMPYFIYNDLILKQLDIKRKEKAEYDRMKSN